MKPAWWFVRVNTDTRLSFAARQLLSWFGSQPRSWRYSVAFAERAMGVSRRTYQKTLVELKASGYVDTHHKRSRSGQIKFTVLTVRDNAPPASEENAPLATPRQKRTNETLRPEVQNLRQTSLNDWDEKEPDHEEQNLRSLRVVGGRHA